MSRTIRHWAFALPLLAGLLACQTQSYQSSKPTTEASTLDSMPADPSVTANGITLTGKLIWHSYPSYSFDGVQSWMVNFDTGSRYEITQSRLRGAMNYHFNQNGTEVVFMSDDNNVSGDEWDIWVASVTATGLSNATKITPTDGSRNEDPKFSSDGTKIIFKKNLYSIVSINRSDFTVNGTNQTPAQTTLLSSGTEIGMPYYLKGSNTNFLYAYNGSPKAVMSDVGGTLKTLYQANVCYYPIALNSTDFYFSQGNSGSPDQIYKGTTSGSSAVGAAFNTSSAEVADACPVDANWLFYTSTRSGGSGSYDIWLGNFSTGATYNLNSFISGSNHSSSDLGATFYGTISTGGGGGSSNLSQGKTATASSTYSGYPASNANDGSLSTLWCAASGTYPSWWQVDLGSNRTITQVNTTFYPQTATAWKYKIQGSTDNATWTTWVDKSSNTTSISSASDAIASKTARYVRIYFTAVPPSADWAALEECVVMGN